MTPPRPRTRLLASTIPMVQEFGVHGAALTELLKRSNTSRNSLYQHFPTGKTEVVETATRIVSRVVGSHLSAMVQQLPTTPSIDRWLDELLAFWLDPLESSDYRLGSFMMAAALDEFDPTVQSAAGQAFTDWTALLAGGLVETGLDNLTARSIGGLLLSAIEGAIIQSRALKSSEPFTDAHSQLSVLLRSQLAQD